MLYRLFLLSLVFCTLQASAQRKNKANEKANDTQTDAKMVGAPMPPFRLIVCRDTVLKKDTVGKRPTHQEVLTNKELESKYNLFVMIFNPTCSHCEDETAMLEKNIELFRKTRLVLMATPVMKDYMPDFVNFLHINRYPEITVGIDSADFMNKLFLYQALPQINIYGPDRKLIKIYSGEVSMDSLKQYIDK